VRSPAVYVVKRLLEVCNVGSSVSVCLKCDYIQVLYVACGQYCM